MPVVEPPIPVERSLERIADYLEAIMIALERIAASVGGADGGETLHLTSHPE